MGEKTHKSCIEHSLFSFCLKGAGSTHVSSNLDVFDLAKHSQASDSIKSTKTNARWLFWTDCIKADRTVQWQTKMSSNSNISFLMNCFFSICAKLLIW